MHLSRGDDVGLRMTKWGDRPHWAMDAVYLGADGHGDWIGFPAGTPMARPGVELVSRNHQVGLVPPAGWLATFHGPGGPVRTYVDLTTVPVWDGPVVRAVDLDLDVIERLDGSVLVDDRDEFDEHRVLLGYPPEVVDLATTTCDWVHTAVRSRRAPFDGRCARWLEVLLDVLSP